MTRFWRRRRETELERMLRARRPEPREDFVRQLAARSRRREGLVPRLALVGALTAAMLVALGAAGSIGYAGNAISSFSSSIRDAAHVSQTNGNDTAKGNGKVASTGQVYAWQDQYDETFPICHKPGTPAEQTLYIPHSAFQGHLDHGDTEGPCPGDE